MSVQANPQMLFTSQYTVKLQCLHNWDFIKGAHTSNVFAFSDFLSLSLTNMAVLYHTLPAELSKSQLWASAPADWCAAICIPDTQQWPLQDTNMPENIRRMESSSQSVSASCHVILICFKALTPSQKSCIITQPAHTAARTGPRK